MHVVRGDKRHPRLPGQLQEPIQFTAIIWSLVQTSGKVTAIAEDVAIAGQRLCNLIPGAAVVFGSPGVALVPGLRFLAQRRPRLHRIVGRIVAGAGGFGSPGGGSWRWWFAASRKRSGKDNPSRQARELNCHL